MQKLVMPDELTAHFIPNENDEDEILCNLPWQIRMRPEYRGFTFGDLLRNLIHDSMHPVLPLGIYRIFPSAKTQGNKGYVWTNPPKDTKLLMSDMIYVLGDSSFGQLAHQYDLLPMGPAGLTNLISFRAARLVSR